MNDIRLSGRIISEVVLRGTATPHVAVELAVRTGRGADVEVFTIHLWGSTARRCAAECATGERLIIAGFIESASPPGTTGSVTVVVHARTFERASAPTVPALDPPHRLVRDNPERQHP